MRLSGFIFLLRKNIFKKKIRALILIGSFAAAIFILGLSVSFLLGAKREAIPRLKKSFPENQIIMSPAQLSVSLIKFNTTVINDDLIAKIKALSGVAEVYPILPLSMPVCAEGRIFGTELTTDLSVNGVDPEFVKDEVRKGYSFSPNTSVYLPVLVSQYFVDLYNLGIAEGNNLPKLSDSAIIGRTFDLILGESTMLFSAKPDKTKRVTCQVVGLTYNRNLLAVVAPLEKIKEFNRWYHGGDNFKYTRVIVKIGSADSIEEIRKSAEKLGLSVSSEKKTLEQFLSVINMVFIAMFSFTLLILALSVMVIANHYSLIFLDRKGEIGIFRALGGAPADTLLLFFFEVCVIGGISGILGVSAMLILKRIICDFVRNYYSSANYFIDKVFYTPIWLIVAIALTGIIISIFSVIPLIFRFVLCEPANLLNEE